MKVEIGKERPAHWKEAWPGEFDFFSHFEHGAVVPQVLSMITTTKQNGKPNACFHSGVSFMGDASSYFILLPGMCNSHTYENILRDQEFSVNFLSSHAYHACKKTVRENGDDTDEIAAGGFTAEPCKTIRGFRIQESILSFECKLASTMDITGTGRFLFVGQVEFAVVDENCHRLEHICGADGFMYNIPSPQNPLTAQRFPTAAAYLTPFSIQE